MTILLIVAAAIVLLWPTNKKSDPILPTSIFENNSGSEIEKTVSYLEAVAALQEVRLRLLKTGTMDEPSHDAINILLMSLVDGSGER